MNDDQLKTVRQCRGCGTYLSEDAGVAPARADRSKCEPCVAKPPKRLRFPEMLPEYLRWSNWGAEVRGPGGVLVAKIVSNSRHQHLTALSYGGGHETKWEAREAISELLWVADRRGPIEPLKKQDQ